MNELDPQKYVRINPRFKLRGWLDQPHALLDSRHAVAHFISAGVFGTLQMCNGKFRVGDALFYGPRQKQLALLAREGVLEFTDEPSELEPNQEYRYYPNHYMRQVQWSMTGHCNYRCRHCFMSAPHGVLPQASTEECLRIADMMGECGIQVVKLTGGECLIRPDFLQIVDRLLENGIQIATILTNGALLNEELLDALEERGVLCGFDISFDGVDGWHDWLRGVEGAEETTIRAFKLCRDRGFPTGAQVIVHRGSLPALRDTIRLLGELGVGSAVVGPVKAEGEALNIEDQILSYDEAFDAFCEYLPQYLEDGAPLQSIGLGGIFMVVNGEVRLAREDEVSGDELDETLACNTLRTTMYLGPDGYILPCIPMSYADEVKERFPNIENMTLAEALTDSDYYRTVYMKTGDVLARNPKCRACAYVGLCRGGCRAKATDENGNRDLLGYDSEMCKFFLGGYYNRAKELLESVLAERES